MKRTYFYQKIKESLQSQLINLGVDVNDDYAWTNPSDAKRLDEFEIVALQDQSILDANPNDNAIRVAELNSELTNYTTELEKVLTLQNKKDYKRQLKPLEKNQKKRQFF